MPETCENWLGLVNSCVYYAHQIHGIYQILTLMVDFKAPGELWNSLSKTVISNFSFSWNKGPVKVWNDHKLKSNMYFRTANIFHNFWHCISICVCAVYMQDQIIEIVNQGSTYPNAWQPRANKTTNRTRDLSNEFYILYTY